MNKTNINWSAQPYGSYDKRRLKCRPLNIWFCGSTENVWAIIIDRFISPTFDRFSDTKKMGHIIITYAFSETTDEQISGFYIR